MEGRTIKHRNDPRVRAGTPEARELYERMWHEHFRKENDAQARSVNKRNAQDSQTYMNQIAKLPTAFQNTFMWLKRYLRGEDLEARESGD